MTKRNRNPFEDHIESEAFDLNPLLGEGTDVPYRVLQPRLEAWLDAMPQPLITGSWDDKLDDMQKQLRACLVAEMIERGMLEEFSEQLSHIDQETIKVLLHYPLTLAMLSQDYFRQNGYPVNWEKPDPPLEPIKSTPDAAQPGRFGRMIARIMRRIRNWRRGIF